MCVAVGKHDWMSSHFIIIWYLGFYTRHLWTPQHLLEQILLRVLASNDSVGETMLGMECVGATNHSLQH